MRRRTFLAVLGGAGLAGCTTATPGPGGGNGNGDGMSGGGDGRTGGGDGTTDDGGTPTPTGDGSPTDDGTPTPDDDSRFAGEPCPSFVEGAERTVCAHAADREREPVLLTGSTELFEPTSGTGVETVLFVLQNDSDRTVGLNPYAWRIERRVGDGWRYVAPDAYIEPWRLVEPGHSQRWRLSVEEHPVPSGELIVDVVQDLDSGVYAFAVDGVVGADAQDARTRVEWVALFEVSR